jgi:hypothetical protein
MNHLKYFKDYNMSEANVIDDLKNKLVDMTKDKKELNTDIDSKKNIINNEMIKLEKEKSDIDKEIKSMEKLLSEPDYSNDKKILLKANIEKLKDKIKKYDELIKLSKKDK